MRFLLISSLACLALVFTTPVAVQGQEKGQEKSQGKSIQKFNPVYGAQSDVNELLAFVSSNIRVELSKDQIRGINGYMVCRFKIDTAGNINTIRVGHSLRPWIDYAIIGAMNRLPKYGIPFLGRRGERKEVDQQLVFSFGTFLLPLDHIGFNGEKIRQNIQNQIDDQLEAANKIKREQNLKWGNFTLENSTLKYDTRNALKGTLPKLPDADPMKVPDIIPRISVSAGELDRTQPAIKTQE
ncbi:MAG: hypothetical protein RR858_02615 [Mucinivorans sp.]